jgi:hypothetical protein
MYEEELGEERESRTYSGFCPTPTNTTSGPSGAENAALIRGNTNRTPEHQCSLVAASGEEMKAMKSLESGPSGRASWLTELGSLKSVETGIFFF